LVKNLELSQAEQDSSNKSLNATGKLKSMYCYDILENPDYQSRFQYIPSYFLDRLSYICVPYYTRDPITNKIVLDDSQEKRCFDETKTSSLYYKPNSETKQAAKCQSDYVRLCIELAYLPRNTPITLTTEGLMNQIDSEFKEQKKSFRMSNV